MSVVHLMAVSTRPEIRTMLLNTIREPRLTHQVVGLRRPLRDIFTRVRLSLRDI